MGPPLTDADLTPPRRLVFRLPLADALTLRALPSPTLAAVPGIAAAGLPPPVLAAPVQALSTVDDTLIAALMQRAQVGGCSNCTLVDPRTYLYVDVDVHLLAPAVQALATSTILVYAYTGTGWSPPPAVVAPPLYRIDQGYRRGPVKAPFTTASTLATRRNPWGVHADGVEKIMGGRGQRVGVHLVDDGWNLLSVGTGTVVAHYAAHEALLRPCFLRWGVNGATAAARDHGMGSLGVLAAGATWPRLRGICREAFRIELYSTGTGGYLADPYNALLAALTRSHPGDVVLLEAQLGATKELAHVPVEYEEHYFQAIRLATALCVLVIEPAGNGNGNLDPVMSDAPREFPPGDPCPPDDSGALVVGAAHPTTQNRMAATNFGSVVRSFAWGSNVSTLTGAATADGYTELFNGTSAAAAIVAGAAAVAQGLAIEATGAPLKPAQLRGLLQVGGSPSSNPVSEPIGTMPNLRAIAQHLGL